MSKNISADFYEVFCDSWACVYVVAAAATTDRAACEQIDFSAPFVRCSCTVSAGLRTYASDLTIVDKQALLHACQADGM